MGKFATFDADIRLATAGISAEAISAKLAAFARSEVLRVVNSGEASPVYETFVNGRKGAAEESVVAPGPILYNFVSLGASVTYALQYLVQRSPVLSGDYARGHFASVDDQIITDPAKLAGTETVVISNVEPYARKIEVGHMHMTVDPGIYQGAQKAVATRFPAFDVRFRMVTRPGGYVLKGVFHRGFRPHARQKLKKDTTAGQPMTYPALVIEAKD